MAENRTFEMELKVLKMKLNHPNIVKGITGGKAELFKQGKPSGKKNYLAMSLAS